jgi:uncharacterized protein DUF4412
VLIALLAVELAAAQAGNGQGVYFEQTTQVAVDGRVAGPGVQTRVWHAGRRMRMEAGLAGQGPVLILRLDQGRAYRLDPEDRVAVQMDVADLRERARQDAATAGELMGAREEGEARTAALPGTRTIAGHVCRGYRISAPSAVIDVYLAPDLPLGMDDFAEFLDWTGASESMAGLLAELRRLPGFPLETRARVSVLGEEHETVSRVTRVRVQAIPAALFEPPPGYRLAVEPRPEE